MMEQLVRSFEDEELCGHFVSKEIKKLWNIQLLMARELLRVCNKHNLKIWGMSGTLLGAIRHEGFIPWDDDMDFMMLRDDYDKLQSIAKTEFKAPYFFQSAYTEKGYYRGHSQIRYDNTAMIIPWEAKMGVSFNQGIFIDIFVSDGFPEKETEINDLLKLRDAVLQIIKCRNYPKICLGSLYHLYSYKRAQKFLSDISNWSDIKLYEYLEDSFKKYPIECHKKTGTLMFSYQPRCIRKTDYFEKTINVQFENIEIPIPAKYDEILQNEYGMDYMIYLKGRSMHGNDLIIDTERSYTYYLSKLKYSKIRLISSNIHSCIYTFVNKILRYVRTLYKCQ